MIRVYVDPEPEHGPHPGYRGPVGSIALTTHGVHIQADCEYLAIGATPTEWPDSEWEPAVSRCLLPWHRVHLIEWHEDRA